MAVACGGDGDGKGRRENIGPVRLAESWLKLAGCVREKHCLAGWMNSAM